MSHINVRVQLSEVIPSALNRSFPLFLCVSRTPYILAKSLAPVSDLDPLDTILYDGTEYGIVTVDMMYKGHMLSVSGDGLDEFFSTLEAQIHTDRIIFLMDMKMSITHKILDKWKDRAIIILQSHRTWGDVFVYFHREEWFTLHLRADAFSTVSGYNRALFRPEGRHTQESNEEDV